MIFALLAVAVGISPVVLPIVLVVAFIWWMARRSRRAAAATAAAPEAARVEPTLGATGEAPAAPSEPGR